MEVLNNSREGVALPGNHPPELELVVQKIYGPIGKYSCCQTLREAVANMVPSKPQKMCQRKGFSYRHRAKRSLLLGVVLVRF
jgi:hypothetical protein